MANEDEILSFEITDQDLADATDISGSRRPKRSKEYATYGIWAQDSDDEGDARPSFGGSASSGGGVRRRPMANFTAPVGFVSAGIQGGPKKKAENEAIEDAGEGPSGEHREIDDVGSSSEEEGSFRAGLGLCHKKMKYTASQGQIAGMRSRDYRPHQSLGKGFGDWEKHTRGIGAKLLLKMGYEAGKGLGKDLQGRSQIVEAHLRKGRGAVGAYGAEGGRPKKNRKGETTGDKGKGETRLEGQQRQWRRSDQSQKTKYVYKTMDEVLEEGKWRKINVDAKDSSSLGKVIDMTGKEQRVLSGYHAIATAKQTPEDLQEDENERPSFALPELVHNLNLLVDGCEEDLITTDRKLRHHRDRVEVLQLEEEKLADVVDREETEIKALNGVLEMVEKLEEMSAAKTLSLDSAQEMFEHMTTRYPKQYQLYELPHIATTLVAPLLKRELCNWRPLEEPTKDREVFLIWKELLLVERSSDADPDPFHALVWESWMPSIRVAVHAWKSREPEPLITLLKTWRDVVPLSILQNLRDLVILPKLQNEVENWTPTTDPVPIHSWLHPWLEVLGSQLEIVYPTIRQKLSSALTSWHPSDKSARLILLPWKDVFENGALQAFLHKNILPKLEMTLHKMVINPQNQVMNEWNWVMDWKDFLSQAAIVNLLQKHFFTKWLMVLGAWLGQKPNYQEVMIWYQGWKKEIADIGQNVLHHQVVVDAMTEAIQLLNRTTDF